MRTLTKIILIMMAIIAMMMFTSCGPAIGTPGYTGRDYDGGHYRTHKHYYLYKIQRPSTHYRTYKTR